MLKVVEEFIVMTDEEIAEFDERVANLITEDDTPVDNWYSAKQQRLLVETLYTSWKPKNEDGTPRIFAADTNVGIFFELAQSQLAPDVFLSLDVKPKSELLASKQRSYFVWEFEKVPELVIEIVSNKKGNEMDGKFKKYAKWGVDYYVVFDPFKELSQDVLRVYEISAGKRYRLREDFKLPELGLSLTLWKGAFEGWQETWLRFCDLEGNLFPTGSEKSEDAFFAIEQAKAEAEDAKSETENAIKQAKESAKQAETERLKAEKLAAKLRELGVDPSLI